jgi:hypothetical protein
MCSVPFKRIYVSPSMHMWQERCCLCIANSELVDMTRRMWMKRLRSPISRRAAYCRVNVALVLCMLALLSSKAVAHPITSERHCHCQCAMDQLRRSHSWRAATQVWRQNNNVPLIHRIRVSHQRRDVSRDKKCAWIGIVPFIINLCVNWDLC